MPGTNSLNNLWPLLLYAGIVAFLLTAILLLSYFLGQHHHDRATRLPYEGGIQQQVLHAYVFQLNFIWLPCSL